MSEPDEAGGEHGFSCLLITIGCLAMDAAVIMAAIAIARALTGGSI